MSRWTRKDIEKGLSSKDKQGLKIPDSVYVRKLTLSNGFIIDDADKVQLDKDARRLYNAIIDQQLFSRIDQTKADLEMAEKEWKAAKNAKKKTAQVYESSFKQAKMAAKAYSRTSNKWKIAKTNNDEKRVVKQFQRLMITAKKDKEDWENRVKIAHDALDLTTLALNEATTKLETCRNANQTSMMLSKKDITELRFEEDQDIVSNARKSKRVEERRCKILASDSTTQMIIAMDRVSALESLVVSLES